MLAMLLAADAQFRAGLTACGTKTAFCHEGWPTMIGFHCDVNGLKSHYFYFYLYIIYYCHY